jgi:flagellar motor switch protein FliM
VPCDALEVVLGEAHIDVKALIDTKVGTLLTLQRAIGEPVEIHVRIEPVPDVEPGRWPHGRP